MSLAGVDGRGWPGGQGSAGAADGLVVVEIEGHDALPKGVGASGEPVGAAALMPVLGQPLLMRSASAERQCREAAERHERVAVSFSGGKDSLAVVYLLRPILDRVTVYHLDTGDLLPEQREIVSHVETLAPSFVRVTTDVRGWIEANGLPTDLLPHTAHTIGGHMGEARTRLATRYDCCASNLMAPIDRRIRGDGNTLVIRGTKVADMNRLPWDSGDTFDGLELLLPLRDWSHAEVMDYLRREGAPISRVYQNHHNSPECATCSAWWSERRARYLREHHPGLFDIYRARLAAVLGEVEPAVAELRQELLDAGVRQ